MSVHRAIDLIAGNIGSVHLWQKVWFIRGGGRVRFTVWHRATEIPYESSAEQCNKPSVWRGSFCFPHGEFVAFRWSVKARKLLCLTFCGYLWTEVSGVLWVDKVSKTSVYSVHHCQESSCVQNRKIYWFCFFFVSRAYLSRVVSGWVRPACWGRTFEDCCRTLLNR